MQSVQFAKVALKLAPTTKNPNRPFETVKGSNSCHLQTQAWDLTQLWSPIKSGNKDANLSMTFYEQMETAHGNERAPCLLMEDTKRQIIQVN